MENHIRNRHRIRFNIRTLLIITALLSIPAWYYGMTLQEYRAEQNALVKLKEEGWRIDSIHKEVPTSPETFSQTLTAFFNTPFKWFIGKEFNERCTVLDITPTGEAGSVAALQDLPYLKHLHTIETCDCDPHVDTLLQLPRLKTINYFIDNISVDSYYRLTAAGIEVSHYGLKNRTFERNYLRYGKRYYPVDLNKSQLGVRLVQGESGIRFSLNINTFEPHPRYMSTPPSLYTVELETSQKLADLIQENIVLDKKAEEDDGSNFYDGIHQLLARNSLQLISQMENELRLKWGFTTDLDEQNGEIEVQLPIKKVIVCLNKTVLEKDARHQAKEIFGRHFDLDGFEEPIFDEKKDRFVFKSK